MSEMMRCGSPTIEQTSGSCSQSLVKVVEEINLLREKSDRLLERTIIAEERAKQLQVQVRELLYEAKKDLIKRHFKH